MNIPDYYKLQWEAFLWSWPYTVAIVLLAIGFLWCKRRK